jgi:predicted O-methyltransferase YrrM
MVIKSINNKKYYVNEDEFNIIPNKEYNNLKIIDKLGYYEKIISLLNEISNTYMNYITNLFIYYTTHGGFIPLNCWQKFSNIYLYESNNKSNILQNIELYKINNIFFDTNNSNNNKHLNIYFFENENENENNIINDNNYIIISSKSNLIANSNFVSYNWLNTNLFIYISNELHDLFFNSFHYFIEKGTNKLNYDNLNHLCIMVKNGGEQFEQMLLDNIAQFDRWTILDTGSNDNTIDIINKVLVGKKKGQLFQEPFINFRDSRNRLLDLAGMDCKFITILDDTYIIDGNLRDFLTTIRGDQYASSFTLYISSEDTLYGSNRIIKTDTNLRYIHKIHEVITDKNNINVVIPFEKCKIIDKNFDYMEKRTFNRKQLDLKLLYEELEEDINNPRTYYYLAQTYNLLQDYEKSYYYFLKRAEFINAGFLQERYDAVFEAARTANFKLNKPWNECMALYEKAFKIDDTRPEALYFIGIHYYLENDYETAYHYFKLGFEVGFPIHTQYSLKPTLSYHFLPKFLTRVCYNIQDYKLGEKSALFFLQNNKIDDDDYQEIQSWYLIFQKLNFYNGSRIPKVPEKPILCFVADGGFNKWAGSNILTSGVGGSETYIIELARYIQKSGKFNVYVFCNCETEEIFEGVYYKHLEDYFEFIYTTYVHTVIVSRYTEYLPVTFDGWSENVYLVVHDLTPSGNVIPINPKLKNIFCLTEWHVSYMSNIFPSLKHLLVPFYYGINPKFIIDDTVYITNKVPYSFIYSSFPNRGLLPLLQMWPKIYEFQQLASLHIYSDIDGKWVNSVAKEEMDEIRRLLNTYKQQPNSLNIFYHGWVSKKVLAKAWKQADIWFYPCIFMETFCLTALEAAASKTLAITNDLAALQNTVGNRGIIVKGNPMSQEWQEQALQHIFGILTNKSVKNNLIQLNYEWAVSQTWEIQATKLLNNFILTNKLEYKNMYNWTNDIPIGTKEIFLSIINYFVNTYCIKQNRKIRVLEIGTYNGISLINLLKFIPNSIGFAVDTWINYNESITMRNIVSLEVEKSFYKNIALEGLINYITVYKCDSTTALINMIKNNEFFDFIYIDRSHLCLDCYNNLILSWYILNKGGIIAIDDYKYKLNNILESPYEAVNKFLNKYNNHYKLLHKDYRIFIEKTC